MIRRPGVLRGPSTGAPYSAPTLGTRRLIIRPHRLDDAAAWYELQGHPGIRYFLSWPERTRRQSNAHLRARTRRTRLNYVDDFLALAVTRKGELVGEVSPHLRATAAPVRTVEVGWLIHPRVEGRGYAAEAAAAVLLDVFHRLDVKLALAVIDPDNHRSAALAASLGFRDTHRDHASLVMVLTKSDLLERLAIDERLRASQIVARRPAYVGGEHAR